MAKGKRNRVPKRVNRVKGTKVKIRSRHYEATSRRAQIRQEELYARKGILYAPTHCDECASPDVVFTTFKEWPDTAQSAIGKTWGNNRMYGCTSCGARVGVHRGTDNPLGYMADRATREARRGCKPVFIEATQVVFRGDRDKAYAWLAKVMRLPASKAHWGIFNVAQCHEAREHTLCLLFDETSYK